jgi:hypothetical protein
MQAKSQSFIVNPSPKFEDMLDTPSLKKAGGLEIRTSLKSPFSASVVESSDIVGLSKRRSRKDEFEIK